MQHPSSSLAAAPENTVNDQQIILATSVVIAAGPSAEPEVMIRELQDPPHSLQMTAARCIVVAARMVAADFATRATDDIARPTTKMTTTATFKRWARCALPGSEPSPESSTSGRSTLVSDGEGSSEKLVHGVSETRDREELTAGQALNSKDPSLSATALPSNSETGLAPVPASEPVAAIPALEGANIALDPLTLRRDGD